MIKPLEKFLVYRFFSYFLLIQSGFLFLYLAIDCFEKSMQGLDGIALYGWYHCLFLLFDRFSIVLFCTTILWFYVVQYYHEWEKFLLLHGSYFLFIRPLLLIMMILGIIFFQGHYFWYDYFLEKRLEARTVLMQGKKKHLINWIYEPDIQSWKRSVQGVVDRSIIFDESLVKKNDLVFQGAKKSIVVNEQKKKIKTDSFHEAFGIIIIPLILSILYLFLFRMEYYFIVSSFFLYGLYWGGGSFFEAHMFWWDFGWSLLLLFLSMMICLM